ncbi:MAG: sugar phosphate isomerase/epimerase, partial [Clostridia bacterium]|nr:sugar phosphate isomerase/epimerase [Clostridia bacterium]
MPAPAVKYADNQEELHTMHEILIESFAEISEYSKSAGIVTALENQSVIRRADSTIKDVRHILDSVPDLRYVFDAGNFFCVREDALEGYEALKDRIVHSHYKDWAFVENGGFERENMKNFDGIPYGKGEIPLEEISKRLIKDGFNIKVVLEYNALSKTIDQLGECADFLVKMFN